jgi:hypothetical protein
VARTMRTGGEGRSGADTGSVERILELRELHGETEVDVAEIFDGTRGHHVDDRVALAHSDGDPIGRTESAVGARFVHALIV